MRIVQLSDLHLQPAPLYSGVDPWLAWQAALDRIAALEPAPDLLLLSGDLANDGAAPTYARLAASLAAAGWPFALLPGNHDGRAALRAAFPGQAWADGRLLCQRVDCGELTLLLLDTLVAGEEWGDFGDAHLAWLDAHCPAGRRVVVTMHHPPCALGIAGMDRIACRGGERLAAWLAGRPQVEAVWCGHVHRLVVSTFAGKMLLTAPATVHQIALVDGPLAWTAEPPGLLVHDLAPGRPLSSHYLPVAGAPVVPYEA